MGFAAALWGLEGHAGAQDTPDASWVVWEGTRRAAHECRLRHSRLCRAKIPGDMEGEAKGNETPATVFHSLARAVFAHINQELYYLKFVRVTQFPPHYLI